MQECQDSLLEVSYTRLWEFQICYSVTEPSIIATSLSHWWERKSYRRVRGMTEYMTPHSGQVKLTAVYYHIHSQLKGRKHMLLKAPWGLQSGTTWTIVAVGDWLYVSRLHSVLWLHRNVWLASWSNFISQEGTETCYSDCLARVHILKSKAGKVLVVGQPKPLILPNIQTLILGLNI